MLVNPPRAMTMNSLWRHLKLFWLLYSFPRHASKAVPQQCTKLVDSGFVYIYWLQRLMAVHGWCPIHLGPQVSMFVGIRHPNPRILLCMMFPYLAPGNIQINSRRSWPGRWANRWAGLWQSPESNHQMKIIGTIIEALRDRPWNIKETWLLLHNAICQIIKLLGCFMHVPWPFASKQTIFESNERI